MDYCYKYPRPAVTVDAVVLAPKEKSTHVLLIQRKNEPFRDHWAFPGGFVDENEDPEDAVGRELEEETGLTGLTFQQAGFYGRPGRDPRGHTISLAFVSRTNQSTQKAIAADDAKDVHWHPLADLPPLAFDHAEILSETLKWST